MLLNTKRLVGGYENAFPLRQPAKGERNPLHCAPDGELPRMETLSEERVGFALSGQRHNTPGQSLHDRSTTPVELQKRHGLLPDQFTCLFGSASSSWPDTVRTPDTHIGFREGITGSCRVVVAQTSAEARGCDSGKVGGLIVERKSYRQRQQVAFELTSEVSRHLLKVHE